MPIPAIMKDHYEGWPNEAGFEALHEQKSPIELPVKGTIPSYAAGVLYRQGPRSYKVDGTATGDFKLDHWFDCIQQTHRFELSPSASGMAVKYNSRVACDRLLEDLMKSGKWHGISFGQKRDPCTSFFGKVMSSFQAATQINGADPSSDNVSVTFSLNMPGAPTTEETYSKKNGEKTPKHASGIRSLYSKTDAILLKQLDPETLEPIGITNQSKLHPSLKGPLSGAHAKSDPETGDLYNYNLELGAKAVYRVFQVSASTGETTILAAVSGNGINPAYLHSSFLTKDYFVLCIWSSHYSSKGLGILWNLNILDTIAPFSTANKVKWLVIDRHHGRGLVAEFESEAMFCFHTVNAWQEEKTGDVICELTTYENTDILHRFYYNVMKSSSTEAHLRAQKKLPGCIPSISRYRLKKEFIGDKALQRSKATLPQAELELKIQSCGELPTINPDYGSRQHRYVYHIVDRGFSTFFDGLGKTDTETQETTYWNNDKGHTPGEAIFIPDPEGTAEDDGVLLSVVLDGNAGTSYLVCLDAKTMREVGRADVGHGVGFGFHGAFAGGARSGGEQCT